MQSVLRKVRLTQADLRDAKRRCQPSSQECLDSNRAHSMSEFHSETDRQPRLVRARMRRFAVAQFEILRLVYLRGTNRKRAPPLSVCVQS